MASGETRCKTELELDAARYQRLRVLGCAPMDTKQLENGTVMRFTNLDEFVDSDLRVVSSRGEPAAVPESAIEPEPQPTPDPLEVRRALWLGHGHTGMYGDDGEMQCNECPIWDYKRAPFLQIVSQAWTLLLANAQTAHAASSAIEVAPQPETHPCPDCKQECRCGLSENHCWCECEMCDCGHHDTWHELGDEECTKCSCAKFTPRPSVAPGEAQREPEALSRQCTSSAKQSGQISDDLYDRTFEAYKREAAAVPSEVAPTREQRLRGVVEAFDPFRRIFDINKQLKPDNNTPFIRFVAGVWPTWGDFKRLVKAVAALEGK